MKAISDPRVYGGFAELKSLPAVQSFLSNSNAGKSWENTLDLFSYGTISDYASASEGCYIGLSDSQLWKLKALTVLTVVQASLQNTHKTAPPKRRTQRNRSSNAKSAPIPTQCGVVPYTSLFTALNIERTEDGSDVRDLEKLLIHCLYSNLLPNGTQLDQASMCLIVKLSPDGGDFHNFPMCRDVNVDGELGALISTLEGFYNGGKNVKVVLDQATKSNSKAVASEGIGNRWPAVEDEMKTVRESIEANGTNQLLGKYAMEMNAYEQIGETDGLFSRGPNLSSLTGAGRKRSRGGRSNKTSAFSNIYDRLS